MWSVADKKLVCTLPALEGAGEASSVCWVVGEAAHCIVGMTLLCLLVCWVFLEVAYRYCSVGL